MKKLKTLFIAAFSFLTVISFSQDLPSSYQALLNGVIKSFETIRGSTSITQGKNTLSVVNENKIALKIEHKKQIKNLTFETQADEENHLYWVATNQLTIDMVNKYENDLTKILEDMAKLAEKKSKE